MCVLVHISALPPCMGPCPDATLEGKVWEDTNANGLQDSGEPGMANKTVELLQDGKVVATTTTDANGTYTFEDVTPGCCYSVHVSVEEGDNVSPQDAGDDAIDSDVNNSGLSAPFNLSSGETLSAPDAGLYTSVSPLPTWL